MRTYTALASNRYFWQMLAVAARSEQVAAKKFAAFLRNRASKANEKYEWAQAAISSDCPADEIDRSNYSYGFDKVEEADFVVSSIAVKMIDSGGNG